MERPDVDALLNVLERLDAELKAVEKEQEDTKMKAASQPAHTLREYKSPVKIRDEATGEELTQLGDSPLEQMEPCRCRSRTT
jgi:hypothetical protein